MAHRRRSISQWIVARCSILFSRITSFLPLSVNRFLGRWLGRLAYYFVPRVRRVAYANLRTAYGDNLNIKQRKQLARRSAENMGIVAAEFTYIRRITPSFVEKHVEIIGKEHLDLARGGLVIGAHLGNWEWMAPIVRTFHDKVAEVVRPLNDPVLDAYVESIRESNGVVTIQKQGAGAEMVRLLREGFLVGVLADQSPRQSAVPVTFYGKRCWATVAPIVAAIRAKVPVYFMSLTRSADGRYTMTISPPVNWQVRGELRSVLPSYAQQVQDAIEQMVRVCPEQWLWAHRRWKARPRLEEEWARWGLGG